MHNWRRHFVASLCFDMHQHSFIFIGIVDTVSTSVIYYVSLASFVPHSLASLHQ